jgi:hypothetical protein
VRKLRDALPGGEQPLRAPSWAFRRPLLSPRLVELNKDASSPTASSPASTSTPAGDSGLDELDLGDDEHAAAA